MKATETAGDVDELNAVLAAALIAIPGVTRIEPRLLSSLQRLAKPGRDVPPLSVRLRDGQAELAVDISTDVTLGGSAVQVALAVQNRAAAVIVEHGFTPGEIDVTVLEVDAAS